MQPFEQSLTIDAQKFHLLGLQKSGAAVYRGASDYLRMGPPEVIELSIAHHRAMVTRKYPVAAIVSEGEFGSYLYFIEKSLGPRSFRVIFQEDTERNGVVSANNFANFLAVMKKLYAAQKKTAVAEWDVPEFAHGIRLLDLTRELPAHADAIHRRFQQACARLKKLPGTLEHGDCNPSNIYEHGIIDVEDSFNGPLGYDIISALTTIEWSPRTRDHEFYAQYAFSNADHALYLRAFPEIASVAEDLAFCRAVWLAANMHAYPRIQQWRFRHLIDRFLSAS